MTVLPCSIILHCAILQSYSRSLGSCVFVLGPPDYGNKVAGHVILFAVSVADYQGQMYYPGRS